MSNIYIQEPPTSGKVVLVTTVGDIDIELWSKEAPKACRNFIQLCMEGYYNGTIFHRVVKGFIVQGGDPTGTGTGGESIYGEPFKDEFHSRLRFNRRGLLAMANAGKDDNGSQFFFTMGPAPELQNKHTVFGKVTGDTVFNMLKLEENLVDADDRPLDPHKIIRAEILNSPFPDIVPRVVPKKEKAKEEKKVKAVGVKNYKLLSFGEEAEEDEEESIMVSKQYSGRSKSTHDILSDPKLSSVPAVGTLGGDEDESSTDSDEVRESVERIRNKLLKKKEEPEEEPEKDNDEEVDIEYEFGKERREERKRKAEEIRREIKSLKRDLQSKGKKEEEEAEEESKDNKKKRELTEVKEQYKGELAMYKKKAQEIPRKGPTRESLTLTMLEKFKNKLKEAKEKVEEQGEEADENEDSESTWMAHSLHFEDKQPVLAKDANTKDDDWFEISDPRNAINKRRREANKQQLVNILKKEN